MGKLESDLIKKKMEERESTAPCLQGVSTEFVLIETHREGDVPHVASNVRYIAFSMRTNT